MRAVKFFEIFAIAQQCWAEVHNRGECVNKTVSIYYVELLYITF